MLVLAKSPKEGGLCVAGRELLHCGIGLVPGGWVRLVSSRASQDLNTSEVTFKSGRQVNPLDVVEIPVQGRVKDTRQPENWLITLPRSWELVRENIAFPPVAWFREYPKELWNEPNSPRDRVSDNWLRMNPPRQSLYLIKPQRFRLIAKTDPLTGKCRRRAVFHYNNMEYDLCITDPSIWDKYRVRTPPLGKPPVEFTLPCGDDLLLCLSLARDFHGFHYKIVAGVFEEAVMSESIPQTLFTVGHSNHSIENFLCLLKQHDIQAIADVRSSPYSRFSPQFNRETLKQTLEKEAIRYVFLGEELGARRKEPDCYAEGKACYRLIGKAPLFRKGLERVHHGLAKMRICLLCAEKDPLHCHRSILVCRHLKKRGVEIQHILEDGGLESQDQVESRLLSELDLDGLNLFQTEVEMLEQAYDLQGEKIAFVELNMEIDLSPGSLP